MLSCLQFHRRMQNLKTMPFQICCFAESTATRLAAGRRGKLHINLFPLNFLLYCTIPIYVQGLWSTGHTRASCSTSLTGKKVALRAKVSDVLFFQFVKQKKHHSIHPPGKWAAWGARAELVRPVGRLQGWQRSHALRHVQAQRQDQAQVRHKIRGKSNCL